MRKFLVAAVPVVLALAGCNSDPSTAPTASSAAMTANGPTRAPSGPNAVAEDLCVKAVQQQTNASGVGVINSEFSQAATQVMVGFPAAQAPWRCLVSGGRVTEVIYTGSEGRS
ncbi:hypothetical protein [Microbaculum sp. FT89]|uniref:hypothetical protein n=1 Tax=Microbaculum sp. FT89 TaxID=3447298 RepID=UPI003F53D6C6